MHKRWAFCIGKRFSSRLEKCHHDNDIAKGYHYSDKDSEEDRRDRLMGSDKDSEEG